MSTVLPMSDEIATEKLGPPGVKGELHVLAMMENETRSDNERLHDNTQRPFKIAARLAKAPQPTGNIKGDFGPNNGSSYLHIPPDYVMSRVRCPDGMFEIKKNEQGEQSLVEFECEATLLIGAETIADFFNAVDLYAEAQREKTWSVLKTKVRARLWVVLPGDIPSAIRSTVQSLTAGSRNRVDIELVAEFIDQPDDKAPLYVADWKARRSAMAHLLRAIDLRLFELPPNVSLAAIRAYGEAAVKAKLNQPAIRPEDAKAAMRNSKLYKEIEAELGINETPFAGASRDAEETANEYRRVQAVASKGDKSLNKAIGLLLAECLKEDAPKVAVVSEKNLFRTAT
jgi:hypothetical protein